MTVLPRILVGLYAVPIKWVLFYYKMLSPFDRYWFIWHFISSWSQKNIGTI